MRITRRKEIMFSILKSVKEGNKNDITHETYGISKDLFFEISEMIKNEGFASNIVFTFDTSVSYSMASINLKGLEYLEENEDLYLDY